MAEFVVKFVVTNGGNLLVKVTISGAPGSGTSTLVSKIVESTGWSSLNGGEVFRNEAKRRNMSVHEFSELCKSNLDVDRSLDSLLKEAMIRSNGPDIIESRLSGWWAHELEIDCNRIWIHTSDEERALRIQKREGGDFSDRLNQSKRRQDADKERYMALYNINLDNMSPYTFVVDADQLSAEEVFSIVIKHLEA